MNTQAFRHTGLMIELCCKYLSGRCSWLCVLKRSGGHFRLNPRSMPVSMSRNSFFEAPFFSFFRSLIHCNWTPTCCHLVDKWTLKHLAKLAKWISFFVSTYLYGAFDCMYFSCHVRISEWTDTLYLPEYQGTPCLKQAQNLKVKRLQIHSNPQALNSQTNTQAFSQTGQMTDLFCEYLYVRCICIFLLCHVRV